MNPKQNAYSRDSVLRALRRLLDLGQKSGAVSTLAIDRTIWDLARANWEDGQQTLREVRQLEAEK
jgi:hypothetical protein